MPTHVALTDIHYMLVGNTSSHYISTMIDIFALEVGNLNLKI